MSASTTPNRERVTVVAHPDDAIAMEVIDQLLNGGMSMTRRPREFDLVSANGATRYSGQINRLSGEEHLSTTPVDVILTDHPAQLTERDIIVRGHRPFGNRAFCPNAARLRNPQYLVEQPEGLLTGSQTFAVFEPADPRRLTQLRYNAANTLGAMITDKRGWDNHLISFPGGVQATSWQRVNRWVDEGRPIELVSACCLNATESRTGIVDHLSSEIVNLLVRCAAASVNRLTPHISGGTSSAFGPNDYDWLGELGISKVLLPYMWDGEESVVRNDLRLNFELTRGLVERLSERLPFPVRLVELSEGSREINLVKIVATSYQRARTMMPGMLKSPPRIFQTIEADLRRREPQLSGLALHERLGEEHFARVQQEVFLYLIDTERYGTTDQMDQDETGYLYLGLEVHGGYIAQGKLNEHEGRLLPLAWLPECVRQHWADWVLRNRHLQVQRARLDRQLRAIGY